VDVFSYLSLDSMSLKNLISASVILSSSQYMQKMVVLTLVTLALFPFGNMRVAAQDAVPVPAEICNGKDDDGNGLADEGVNCDHYLSYLVDKSINPITVLLKDQFISYTDFTLTTIERLFNPVRKLHAGLAFSPRRPDLHYLAYRVKTSAPFAPRPVLIENQFERREIQVLKPRYLLAPAGKKKIGIPTDRITSAPENVLAKLAPSVPQHANHYLCYDIEPYDVADEVLLRDQFQKRLFKVVRALYLCNPAVKNHNGQVYDIVDENTHLMCYEVLPHNLVNRPVLTHDQFGVKGIKALQTEELCVPTRKTPLHTTTCTLPDDNGTAVVFDANTTYHNTENHLVIAQPTPTGEGLTANALLQSGPDTVISRSGTPETGETYTIETEILQLTLSSGRVLHVPLNGTMTTQPRTPGDAVQSFDTEMLQLQGQLPPGDPDFDLLRVTAGASFGLPSPGHTTLTQLPNGNWNIDSFFDITYRIDFIGAPGGPLAGQSASEVGTVRISRMCQE